MILGRNGPGGGQARFSIPTMRSAATSSAKGLDADIVRMRRDGVSIVSDRPVGAAGVGVAAP